MESTEHLLCGSTRCGITSDSMWNQLYVESTQLLCWINLDSMWNQVYVKLTQLLCGIKSASPRICSRELLWGINQASFTEKSLCGFHPAGLMCNKLYVESTQLLLRICASQLLRWHRINPASLTKKSLCGINSASPTDQEASWERVFDPVYNLLFDLYH